MSDKELFKAVRQYEELGEVVTCGECKYYKPYSHGNFGICQRSDDDYEISGYETVEPSDDYCSRGVRKENK